MRSLALTLALLAAPKVAPAANVTAVTTPHPRVEVAFVLDTTGSMGGLIEGAKRRIWSIARQIGDGRPRPDLRIALVAYRDKGDEYVTRVFDLTADMDDVYRNLMSFQAAGGGDWPEHVSAALHDAVHKVSWSQNNDALKMIFLVGDAPPHMDYQDGFDYRLHAREAAQRRIIVETIECGADPQTAQVWQEIASLAQGHFARIDANGGMPAQVTPMDAELARLNGELSSTVVAGGSAAEQAVSASKVASRSAMSAPMAAEAAGYFAKADKLADRDLVSLSTVEQKKELDDMKKKPGDAPAALKGKTDAEAMAFLKEQQDRRAKIQGRIVELSKQREAFLSQSGTAKDGFDAQVIDSLRSKAAEHGITY
jgi:hypothetical protein